MNRRTRLTAWLLPFLLVTLVAGTRPAVAQLRIVDWNSATDTNPAGDVARAGTSTVLQAIGIDSRNGIQRPIDILTLQEVDAGMSGADSILGILNGLYGAGTYARSTVVGGSTDGTTQAVIYNTHTVSLVSQTAVGTASTSGAARAPTRYEFQPTGYDSNSNFYLYSSHYKAGTASSDQSRRSVEAATIRNDANALPTGANTNAIFAGDYNIQSSSETMYQILTGSQADNDGRAFDPLNTPGTWHANASFAPVHTQAPTVPNNVNGLIGGGMDDRFDFQLVTSPLMDGEGLSYIGTGVPNTAIAATQHSYNAFGNNGTTFDGNINQASNTALPVSEYNPGPGQPSRADVLNALTTASDHLPVVADYQLPAKMGASVAAVPAQVIKDTPLATSLNVANTAPVAVAIGADELDYGFSASGSASGAGASTALPLATANVHAISLNTSTLGPQAGGINATATSAQAASPLFNTTVNYTVLDHAAGDFIAATGPQSLTIDFGTLLLGAGTVQEDFQLTNLSGLYRAGLDLNSFSESGDAANRFATDLSPFFNLSAGSNSSLFHAMFAIDQLGTFSAHYLLNVADQAGIYGGAGDVLSLNLTGTVVVPEPASVVFASLGLAALVGAYVRGRKNRKL